MSDTLNYECEVLDPNPTDPDWQHFQFHGDNLSLAYAHMHHLMMHQGIKVVRFRKLGTTLWRHYAPTDPTTP